MNGPEKLVVIGGGEHAQVVIEAARSCPDRWVVAGFVDEAADARVAALDVPWLGSDERAGGSLAGSSLVLGVGGLGVAGAERRRAIVARYAGAGSGWATVVHARAWVSPSAVVGAGTVVLGGAVVNAKARIGDHCIVNTGAVIEHDVALGDFVHAGPAAAIGGGTSIGEESALGLGCRIRDHIRVGRRVTVGMGATVVGTLDDGVTVVGTPARERKP